MKNIFNQGIRLLPAAISTALFLGGCDDSLDSILPTAKVEIEVIIPDNASANAKNQRFTFRNISNGTSSSFLAGETINLLPGLYDVTYSASTILPNGGKADLKALRQSVTLSAGENRLILEPYVNITSDDFIISEIFFTGTLQTSGNMYYGDDYIKLYNNTDHILYADGLTIFESKFSTTEKTQYTPDIMAEAMTVDALYTIPGNG